MHWLGGAFIEGAELWETYDAGENWVRIMNNNSVGFLTMIKNGDRIFFSTDIGDIFYSDDVCVTVHNANDNLAISPTAPVTIIGKRPDGTLFANN